MFKLVSTLRTHWKKSVVFGLAASYGIHWAKLRLEDNAVMKQVCLSAKAYGDMPLANPTAPVYRVTVILNPAASKGSAKKKFEKYCAPVLHLGGLKVSVIRTEGEGQAKDIMEVMKDADAVLIAGGDGTVMEAITGFMRRPDAPRLTQALPVGILPVGHNNSLAKRLYPSVSTARSDVELMANCALSCVEQTYRPMDVMQVENISKGTPFSGKKIYCMTEFCFGAFRDAHERMSKYWYFSGLKKAMTYIFSYTTAAKEILWECSGDIEIGAPVPMTLDPPHAESASGEAGQTQSWWTFFFGGSQPKSAESAIQSPEKSAYQYEWDLIPDFDGMELSVRMPQISTEEKGLNILLGPTELGFLDFVGEGWRRETEQGPVKNSGWQRVKAPVIRFRPAETLDKGEKFFSLDNESIEVKGPIQISLLKDKITMFCSKEMKVAVPQNPEQAAGLTRKKKWWQASGRTFATTRNLSSFSKQL